MRNCNRFVVHGGAIMNSTEVLSLTNNDYILPIHEIIIEHAIVFHLTFMREISSIVLEPFGTVFAITVIFIYFMRDADCFQIFSTYTKYQWLIRTEFIVYCASSKECLKIVINSGRTKYTAREIANSWKLMFDVFNLLVLLLQWKMKYSNISTNIKLPITTNLMLPHL